MRLKNRLILSNAAVIVIPIVVTVLSFLFMFFIIFKVFNSDSNYQELKNLASIQYRYFYTWRDLENLSNDAFKKEYQDYILGNLKNKNVDIFIFKESNQIFGSSQLSLIDQEKCIQSSKTVSVGDNININGKTYIVKVIPFGFKDNEKGTIFLMSESKEHWFGFEKILIFCGIIYIISFIITNIIVSLRISKSILSPLSKLRNAAINISGGNLETIITEDGDEEIRNLCTTFELMRIKLKEITNERIKIDESRKILISSISHDLKTPITTIKGYVEGIIDGIASDQDKVTKYLQTIYSKADLMDKMIDDLFLYSKLDLKQLPFKLERVEVKEYFDEYINDIKQELAKSGITIVLNSSLDQCTYIIIDKERVKRVIMNIVENAKKYMDDTERKIEVNLRETNASIIIEIKDNGIGIAKKDLPYIFDRFYRSNSARNKISGSGLGLSISKQIIEGIGGKIWAKSKLGCGTSIILSIKKSHNIEER